MGNKYTKVFYLTNIPAPYTIHFFNELNKLINLDVYFERQKASDRNDSWNENIDIKFDYLFLKGRKFGKENAICFDVIKYLKNLTKETLVVVGNYSSPTGIIAIKYLKLHKIPFCIHADGGVISKENFIKKRFKKSLISSAMACFSPGINTDKYFIYYGNKESQIFRYPFTSVTKNLMSKKCPDKQNKEKIKKQFYKEEVIILFVGSLTYRKGIDILIKSARTLSGNYGIYIIGGNPSTEIEKLLDTDIKDRIHFVDFILPKEVLEYMKYADIFVFPTRKDVWGLVVNEALSQGLPVISSDQSVAGLELIKDGYNGYIFKSEDYIELSEKIQYLIDNPNERARMRKNSLDSIKEYTIENMAKTYFEVINKLSK